MVYLGRTVVFPFPKDNPTGRGSPRMKVDAYLNHKTSVELCSACPEATWKRGCCDQHDMILCMDQRPKKPHEAVVVHHDCFAVFIQSCPLAPRLACERLWEAAIARRPWPSDQGVAPFFRSSQNIMCLEAMERIAAICNMRQLANLPAELVEQIQSYCPGYTTFWGTVAALTVASCLSKITPLDGQQVELGSILYWERGGKIQDSGPGGPEDVLRIVYDMDGVRKIERLPRWPDFERQEIFNGKLGWAIVRMYGREVEDIAAFCKDGYLRFNTDGIPSGRIHRIWNTPTPPASCQNCTVSLCQFISPYPYQTGHLIDLASISGITFGYSGDYLEGIHLHRGKKIKALIRHSQYDRDQACFFLPVDGKDKIMAIGARVYLNALIIVVSFFSSLVP